MEILHCMLFHEGAHFTMGWLTLARMLYSSLLLLLDLRKVFYIGVNILIRHLWTLRRQYT